MDIQIQLKSFADDYIIGDWGTGISDKTYQRSNTTLKPIRFNAVVGYFFKGETSLWKTTASVAFVYILGVDVYHCLLSIAQCNLLIRYSTK